MFLLRFQASSLTPHDHAVHALYEHAHCVSNECQHHLQGVRLHVRKNSSCKCLHVRCSTSCVCILPDVSVKAPAMLQYWCHLPLVMKLLHDVCRSCLLEAQGRPAQAPPHQPVTAHTSSMLHLAQTIALSQSKWHSLEW